MPAMSWDQVMGATAPEKGAAAPLPPGAMAWDTVMGVADPDPARTEVEAQSTPLGRAKTFGRFLGDTAGYAAGAVAMIPSMVLGAIPQVASGVTHAIAKRGAKAAYPGMSEAETAKIGQETAAAVIPAGAKDPVGILADAAGGATQNYYRNSIVAQAMDLLGKGMEKGSEVIEAKTGLQAADTMASFELVMGAAGAKGGPAMIAASPRAAKAAVGAVKSAAEKVQDALAAVGKSKKRVEDRYLMEDGTPYAPLDPTLSLPPEPTKAEIKAHEKLVNELVVDAPKLKSILGMAKKAGPEAEIALVQNIFDRVLKPQEKKAVPPRAARPAPVLPPDQMPAGGSLVDSALQKQGEGLLLTAEEAKAARRAPPAASDAVVVENSSRVGQALDKLSRGLLLTTDDAKAIRTMKVDAAKGWITDASGRPRFTRGAATPEMMGVLAVMGFSALAAKEVYDWWNNTSGLSDDNTRDVASGLAAAGGAGAIKGKGGAWDLKTLSTLRNKLMDGMSTGAEVIMDHPPAEVWANRAVKTYAEKHAGTATDPLKDIILPNGQRWEDLTDLAVRQVATGERGDPIYGLAQSYPPGQRALGQQILAAKTTLADYMSHVGDYLKANVPPDKLPQYDLVRAVKETKAWDERLAKEAAKAEAREANAALKRMESMTVVQEFPATGMKLMKLDRPGDFAHESTVMGHSVRGYEPQARSEVVEPLRWMRMNASNGLYQWYLDSKLDTTQKLFYIANSSEYKAYLKESAGHPDWVPESEKGVTEARFSSGHPDYGLGGWDAIKRGDAEVLSLRDAKGGSHVTVEIKKEPFVDEATRYKDFKEQVLNHPRDSVLQIRGKGNSPVPERYQQQIADFLNSRKWGEVRDLDNAGIREVSPDTPPYIKQALGNNRFVPEAKLREVMDAANEGRLRPDGPQGQRGSASPRDMALLAGATGLALYLYNSADSDEAKSLMAGAAGVVGLGKLKGTPEPRLLEMLKEGGKAREAAATQIYIDNAPMLERSLRKYERQGVEVEDVVQRTLEKGLRAMEKGQFTGDSKIQTYLYRIAENEAKTNLRYEKVRPRTEPLDLTEGAGKGRDDATAPSLHEQVADTSILGMSPEQRAATDTLAGKMASALDKLPENFRRPFEMRELQGMDYQEIADALGQPIGTVRSQINRAKEQLQRSLQEYNTPGKAGHLEAGRASVGDMMKVAAVAGGAALGAAYANDPQAGAVVGGLLALGSLGLRTKAADVGLGRSTTRLAEIDPTLRRAGRDQELVAARGVAEASNYITPFLKAAKGLPKEAFAALDKAYSEANPAGILAAIRGNPKALKAYSDLRAYLDKIGGDLVAVGRFKEGLPDYLPLMVKDYRGLMESLGRPVKEGLEGLLHKENIKAIKKLGRELNEVEKATIVNNYLLHDPATSFLPGFAKARRLKMTEATRPFYHSLEDALIHYAHAAVSDLATTRFFAQDLRTVKVGSRQFTNVEGSIGALIARAIEEGRMTPEQAKDVRGILHARFTGGEKAPSGWLQDVRNVAGTALLGQLGSGLIQTSEALLSTYHHGVKPAVAALGTVLTGRGIKPGEFGLANHVIEEVVGSRVTGKVLSTVLKLNLLAALDQLGMSQNLTASFVKNKALAATVRGQKALAEKWGADYGPDMPRLIAELQQSTRTSRTPLVDSLLYQELSDVRPTSRLESPEFFNAHPNVRILYHLKQFMLTQADILRRDSYQKIKSGDPKQVAVGLKNLALYSTALATVAIPADALKDWLFGRPLRLDKIDYVDNFVRNFGLSRYTLDKVSESRTPGKTMIESAMSVVTPPAASAAANVAKGLSDPKELVPLIPVGGRAYYNRELGGNEKWAALEAKKERLAARDAREKANPQLKAERLRRVEAAKKRVQDKARKELEKMK